MQPIFTTGDGKRKQYAMRLDGTWFVRYHRDAPLPGWSGWMVATEQTRPYASYYDPSAGKARLPK